MIHAERHIPLHDGILERTLDEVEHERIMERDFWARIAAERTARSARGEVRNRAHTRDATRLSKQG